MITRTIESSVISGGRKMGKRIFETNNSVIKGTPRIASIKPIDNHLIKGNFDCLPNAKRTPTGSDKTIPESPTIRFSIKPPNLSVGTSCKPRPPANRIVAIAG